MELVGYCMVAIRVLSAAACPGVADEAVRSRRSREGCISFYSEESNITLLLQGTEKGKVNV